MNPELTKQKMLHFDAIALLQLEARTTCENEKAYYQAKYAEVIIELTRKPIDYALNNCKIYEGEDNPVSVWASLCQQAGNLFRAPVKEN